MRSKSYHIYTDEDLNYIKEHRYDNVDDVAAAIGGSRSTIEAYMRRFRRGSFTRKSHRPHKYYALYLRETDELVCSGSAKECAEALGIGVRAFYVMANKSIHGVTKKWDVYVEPYIEEN